MDNSVAAKAKVGHANHYSINDVVGFAILGCLSMFEMHPSSLGYEFHSLSYFSKFTFDSTQVPVMGPNLNV
jgi:hypothetical protein